MYINVDERYGKNTQTTLEDYQRLNPEGTFRYANTGSPTILEDFYSADGEFIHSLVIAVDEESYQKSLHLYQIE